MGFKMAGGACCCCKAIHAQRTNGGWNRNELNGGPDDGITRISSPNLSPDYFPWWHLGVDRKMKLAFAHYFIYDVGTGYDWVGYIFKMSEKLATPELIFQLDERRYDTSGFCDQQNSRLFFASVLADQQFGGTSDTFDICKLNYDGTGYTVLVTHTGAAHATTKTAYDPANDLIFYSRKLTGGGTPYTIRSIESDGTNDAEVLTGANYKHQISFSTANSKLYYLSDSRTIRRCDGDGTNDELVYTAQTNAPNPQNFLAGLDVSNRDGLLYFWEHNSVVSDAGDQDTNGLITLDLDGGNRTVVLKRTTTTSPSFWGANNAIGGSLRLGCGLDN